MSLFKSVFAEIVKAFKVFKLIFFCFFIYLGISQKIICKDKKIAFFIKSNEIYYPDQVYINVLVCSIGSFLQIAAIVNLCSFCLLIAVIKLKISGIINVFDF